VESRKSGQLHKLLTRSLVVSVLVGLVSGCGVVRNAMYKTTGDVMVGFAQEHQVAYMMTTDDVRMNCAMAESLTPLLMSFSRVRATPDQVAIMVMSSAGMCAEAQAWEEELRYIRAIRQQNAIEAEDALISQKRLNILAAQRNFKAYEHMVTYFGEPGGQECPKLGSDFDELTYMLGMLAGLQALNNEITSTAGLGVPKNIAAKVERSTACLSDDKWWGMPGAVRALIWAMLPGAEPQGESYENRMKAAVAKGEKAGVRISHVMQALAYYNKGDTEALKNVIRQHVKVKERKAADPDYKMVDELATTMLTALSDKMWTEATGYRTPIGGLGTFWDDKKAAPAEAIDLDDIL
jgi:hypothetical protein